MMGSAASAVRGRRRRWSSRFRRMALEILARDPRFRRTALTYLFSRHLDGDILCLVPFEDHQLFVNPRDDKISFSLMSGKQWQRGDLECAFRVAGSADRLRQGSVFVDVGANIGAMTIYACLSGLFRHVVAVEPDALNRSILDRNVAVNGLADQVTVVPVAASSASGEMTLYRDQKNLGAHSLEAGFAMTPGSSETVAVMPIDEIVTQAGFRPEDVGFVKIDVEGHEVDVLRGMSQVMANAPPILVEATFNLHDKTQPLAAPIFAAVPTQYRWCADVALRPGGDEPPPMIRLDAFVPTSLQHDLVML